MSSLRSSAIAVFAAAALFVSAEAQASPIVVGFDALVNFANYSEDGVTMTSDNVWNWPGGQMAHMDGGDAVFELATLGDFSLLSVDKLESGGTGIARFEGFLDGLLVATEDVSLSGVHNFGAAFALVDSVRLTPINNHFTVDDLTLAAVPEPATLGLVGLGLALAAARRRRQSAR